MQGNVVRVTSSELEAYIEEGQVENVQLMQASNEAHGDFIESSQAAEAKKTTKFIATYEPERSGQLVELMKQNNVKFDFVKPSFWDSLFSPSVIFMVLLFAIPLLFIFWLMNRQMQGGGNNQAMNFGKSRARLASDGKRRITFADVAGVDEAVAELTEVVDFLREPKKYEALGAEIPKGVLLVGPPGCGKTHLAKAVAGEANVPFFYISGSDFVEMFVGVGASRVRDLFDQAKRRAPCLIFIDELDAVGRHRGTGIGGTHDEREQTLNQMLVEMDGFEPNSGIIVLAATNRPDVLDPALLRPGRFDRRIVVDAPDLNGRLGILKIYARNKPFADDINLEEVAQRTPGFSGADLKNTINEAALLAARLGAKKVHAQHLYEAIDRVIAGPERKSRIINEREKKIIAYHELGHAIVSHFLLDSDPVHKISILPRGQALGYTLNFPEEDRFLVTRQQIISRVCAALGGRAAEDLVFQEITTGAQNDLERSTQMVRSMITKYGMSDELGPIQFGNQHDNPFLGRSMMEDRNYSDEIAYRIDKETKRIVEECFEKAEGVLRENREKMDFCAAILMEKEYLDRQEFEDIMANPVPEGWGPGDSLPESVREKYGLIETPETEAAQPQAEPGEARESTDSCHEEHDGPLHAPSSSS
jgi:cell division protease FtsH